MIGLIIYLSTIVFFPIQIALLALPIFLIRLSRAEEGMLRPLQTEEVRFSLAFLATASIFAISIFIFIGSSNGGESHSILTDFPYVLLIFCAAIVATGLKRADFIIFTVLFLVEVVVGIIEYAYGVRSFFDASALNLGETGFGATDLLYYNRVFGLSDNSSQFAYKALIVTGILYTLKDYFNSHRKFFLVLSGALLVSLGLTFNRTTIISIAAFLFLTADAKKKIIATLFSIVLFLTNLDLFTEQLFRGKEGIDLSGRDQIFSHFFIFIEDNLFFGNGGKKLWLIIDNRIHHAHNSYLELFASNGVIVTLLVLISVLVVSINKRTINLVALFGIYSVFQYGVFWGYSAPDIMFYGLLFYAISKEQKGMHPVNAY